MKVDKTSGILRGAKDTRGLPMWMTEEWNEGNGDSGSNAGQRGVRPVKNILDQERLSMPRPNPPLVSRDAFMETKLINRFLGHSPAWVASHGSRWDLSADFSRVP